MGRTLIHSGGNSQWQVTAWRTADPRDQAGYSAESKPEGPACLRLPGIQGSKPNRTDVQSPQAVPSCRDPIRQDTKILLSIPRTRRRKDMAAILCQQGL